MPPAKLAQRVYLFGFDSVYREQPQQRLALRDFDKITQRHRAPDVVTVGHVEHLFLGFIKAKLSGKGVMLSMPEDLFRAMLAPASPVSGMTLGDLLLLLQDRGPALQAPGSVVIVWRARQHRIASWLARSLGLFGRRASCRPLVMCSSVSLLHVDHGRVRHRPRRPMTRSGWCSAWL